MMWIDKRHLKWWWQRRTRGFDDRDLWSFDVTIAEFILPRMKRFRNHHMGHPSRYTDKQWNKIMDQIIEGFELALTDANYFGGKKGDMDKIVKAWKLLGEHGMDFWD